MPRGGKYARAIKSSIAEAQKLGITGTSTLLLGVGDGNGVKLVRKIVGAAVRAV
jgi:hypothetical protein